MSQTKSTKKSDYKVGDIINMYPHSLSGTHNRFARVEKISPACSLHVQYLETEHSEVHYDGLGGGEITKPKNPIAVIPAERDLLRPKKDNAGGYSIKGRLFWVSLYDPDHVYRNESYF